MKSEIFAAVYGFSGQAMAQTAPAPVAVQSGGLNIAPGDVLLLVLIAVVVGLFIWHRKNPTAEAKLQTDLVAAARSAVEGAVKDLTTAVQNLSAKIAAQPTVGVVASPPLPAVPAAASLAKSTVAPGSVTPTPDVVALIKQLDDGLAAVKKATGIT